jgi:hypothetical protein
MAKQLVFPSEFKDGMYRTPPTVSWDGHYHDNLWSHNGHLHTIAFQEGDNVYLRRTTGEMGALRRPWLFLLAISSLISLTTLTMVALVVHRSITFTLIVSGGLSFTPAYLIVKSCLYPEPREWRAIFHRDI